MKFYTVLLSLTIFISCSPGSKKSQTEVKTKQEDNRAQIHQQEKTTQIITIFHKMNEKIIIEDFNGNYELELVKKEETVSLNNHQAKDGFKYVSIQIKITNPLQKERAAEIPDFFLYTTKEEKRLEDKGYQRTSKPYCKEPFFQFPILAAGKSYIGWETFEIPKDSNHLFLGYKTAMFTGEFIYFELQ